MENARGGDPRSGTKKMGKESHRYQMANAKDKYLCGSASDVGSQAQVPLAPIHPSHTIHIQLNMNIYILIYIYIYIFLCMYVHTYGPCQLFGIVFQLGDHSTRGTIVLVSDTLSPLGNFAGYIVDRICF